MDIVMCSQCIFWKSVMDAPPIGECRRYAPKPLTIKQPLTVVGSHGGPSSEALDNRPFTNVVAFPRTSGDTFCGEGKKREAKKSE